MKRGVKVEERFVELRIFDMLKMRGSPGGAWTPGPWGLGLLGASTTHIFRRITLHAQLKHKLSKHGNKGLNGGQHLDAECRPDHPAGLHRLGRASRPCGAHIT